MALISLRSSLDQSGEIVLWEKNLMMELDKLKMVYRRTYLSDCSRHENSAEHSWHLAVSLLALRDFMPDCLDIDHTIRMSLMHDICEIGAGDISVYDSRRSQKASEEGEYLNQLSATYGEFGEMAYSLWREYEDQKSEESRWVKVADRLLPFLLNLATHGKTWKEQDICRSQVLEVNRPIAEKLPEIYNWMVEEIEHAVQSGWLRDA